MNMENATKNWEQMTYPFFNIKLNYTLGALAPFIDEKSNTAVRIRETVKIYLMKNS